jgi:hypothetical protein
VFRLISSACKRAPIIPIWAPPLARLHAAAGVQLGGSARGYQAIFVSLADLSSPGYGPIDGQPAVYVYIAAIEVNVLNCRRALTRDRHASGVGSTYG